MSDAGMSDAGMSNAGKVEKVMGEFKRGTLHSGSSRGPAVKSRKQAVAIALSEARRTSRRTSRDQRDAIREA